MARSDEADYAFRDRHPERDEVYALYDRESERIRREAFCLTDLSYGSHARMTFDFFPGPRNAPLLVFFHGGYWQGHDNKRFSFVARPLLGRGFSIALPNYPLAPETTPERIVDAAASSIPAIIDEVIGKTGNPSCWLTAGHSAGGQLAVWAGIRARSYPAALSIPFAGTASISGVTRLQPLIGTSLNRKLRLTRPRAARLSPLAGDLPAACYRVIVGADETRGFLDQSARFAEDIQSAGRDVAAVVLAGLNHYTILKDFLTANSVIAGALGEIVDAGGRGHAGRRQDSSE